MISMNSKALLTAILVASTNIALANGGLNIDNVGTHMNATQWSDTNGDRPEIVAQGPIEQFEVTLSNRDKFVVNTNKLKQSYNGKA